MEHVLFLKFVRLLFVPMVRPIVCLFDFTCRLLLRIGQMVTMEGHFAIQNSKGLCAESLLKILRCLGPLLLLHDTLFIMNYAAVGDCNVQRILAFFFVFALKNLKTSK